METINLTPVGVAKDPERVNRAVEAFTTAQANACNELISAIRELKAYGLFRGEVRSKLADAADAADAALAAQEEFLRAVAGAPSVSATATRT